MRKAPPAVRPVAEADLGAINDLYNHYIRTSPATFDLEEHDLSWRRTWLAEHSSAVHRVMVAERDGRLAGFASSGPHRYERPMQGRGADRGVVAGAEALHDRSATQTLRR